MRFFADIDLPIRPDIVEAFEREWVRLAAPGAAWSGSDRIEIAAQARTARAEADLSGTLDDRAIEAARLLGARPAEARRDWADAVIAELGPERFVEMVGVVARTSAVDSFHQAVGSQLPDLPEPRTGEPSGVFDGLAGTGPAWVPMVGGASIVFALSLVPSEAAAQEDLHGPLYLTYDQMSEQAFERGLTRAQMEVVAARTSAVNECFY